MTHITFTAYGREGKKTKKNMLQIVIVLLVLSKGQLALMSEIFLALTFLSKFI